ncbi:hypothetical protein [Rhodococcus sp. 05-2255-3B1]|uniref:hypothetical protein n=1 Tax=Rhodococcus sp. 05-2255-3B1 TaxID=2022482 RepID=UPI0015C68498|nr:hypothetical protein [Rhodococcus sp. 05-2255-3B1]
MTTREPVQTRDELRAEMKAAARKMWDEADIQVSPHLANAIRRVVQSDDRRAS